MQKGRLVVRKGTSSSFFRYWDNSIPSVAIKINTPPDTAATYVNLSKHPQQSRNSTYHEIN